MKKSENKGFFKKHFTPFRQRWPFLLVLLFFLGRLALNLQLKPLQIFFAVSYVILILLMLVHKKSFFFLTIVFLFVDSLIGTYIFTTANNLGIEYFGTMIINLFFILLLIYDKKNNFR